MNYMQWHLSNALEKKKEQKLRSKLATNNSPAPLVNQQITIRGRSETRKQVCNRLLMFWRVLIRFLTDLVSLKVEDLSLKELCTQVRQKKKKYVDESLPEWVWPNFFPNVRNSLAKFLVIFFVEIKNTKMDTCQMNDLSFFDLLWALWMKKGFSSCMKNKNFKENSCKWYTS